VASGAGTVKRPVSNIQADREPTMAGDLEMRRRRAQFRASHRGTKEMDWLLGRFAEAKLAGMDEVSLAEFEGLLAQADPDIEAWFMQRAAVPGEHARLMAELMAFHGLEPTAR